MKHKIAFFLFNLSLPRGVQRAVSLVANSLSDVYDITIIGRNGDKPYFSLNDNIDVRFIYAERPKGNLISRKLKTYETLEKIVKEKNIELVICADVGMFTYALPLKLKGLCKVISWEHTHYNYNPFVSTRIGRQLAIKYADYNVVLSNADLKTYKEKHKSLTNITNIYNPLSFSAGEKSTLYNKKVIAVGRLTNVKGFDMLLDIWKIVELKHPDWRLDIFGEGEERENLEKRIFEYNLKNVHLNGSKKNIHDEYQDASIMVMTSRSEGFGFVLVEAQTKGLPCVSFNCKIGPSEIIRDGVNGFLVEPGDIEGFAEKLDLLMSDEELRKRFSNNACIDHKRYDIKNIKQKWIDLLERCLND